MILALCPNPSVDTVLWLNEFKPGQMVRAVKEQRYPGGKGVHVAAALKQLGEVSAVLGFWAGPTGEWLRQECDHLGVSTHGPTVRGWTRTCLSLRGAPEFDETEILELGPEIPTAAGADFLREVTQLGERAQLVTMSGSLPRGLDSRFYADCVERIHSLRLPVIADFTGPALEQVLKLKPYAVHLNLGEGRRQTSHENPLAIVKHLATAGSRVALTCGAAGLWWAGESQVWRANVTLERALGTVGSGDCLVAGMAYAIAQKWPVEDTLRWAVACGAANCLREDLGLLYKKDVDQLYSQVKIERIE